MTDPVNEPVTFTVPDAPTIAVLGGTGAQGMGLAYRWAASGLSVLIGSRQGERALAAAEEIGLGTQGATNAEVARDCDVAVIAVPWAGHEALVYSMRPLLTNKLVVDCVNPLAFDENGPHAPHVPEGSAAQQAQHLLSESVVVGAFHNVSATHLLDRAADTVDADTLVLGDDRAATDAVIALANRVPGMRGVYGGRLRNCAQVEALTANLIAINRRYKSHASIRITDLP